MAWAIALSASAIVALASGLVGPQALAQDEVKLDETAIFIEINDTDGDAGIQIFLDGEGWDFMMVTDPNGAPEENVRVNAGALFDFTDAQGQYEVTGL